MYAKGLLCALALALCLAQGEGARRRGLGAPQVPRDTPLPPDQWFVQLLDHFDPTNQQTWSQRYQTNDTFFTDKQKGPVFLMIGGEGEASANWMVKGAWIEYAQKFGALCFQLEHRFYGKSHPTQDMSVENLRYLSSEQALADLAYFIEGMNKEHGLSRQNKWIVFGGSYPGSLAAWARFKYPHLIHGAMSASGPLIAKSNFSEYFDVVRDSLNTHSVQCSNAVEKSIQQVSKALIALDVSSFATEFKLCDSLDVSNTDDVSQLVENLSNMFADVVQYNKDNRFTPNPLSRLTIDDICTVMTNISIGEPIDRLAALNSLVLELSDEPCLDHSYANMIADMKNVSWDSEASEGGRQWTYQTCTEFGFYQTSSSSDELFGSFIPLDFYVKQCADIYGDKFPEDLLNKGIERTNIMYGELDLKVSRVVFVHGSIDPWHALGVTRSRRHDAPAIYIDGTAHCANMYPSTDNDPKQLKEARKRIYKYIRKWLSEECEYFN